MLSTTYVVDRSNNIVWVTTIVGAITEKRNPELQKLIDQTAADMGLRRRIHLLKPAQAVNFRFGGAAKGSTN